MKKLLALAILGMMSAPAGAADLGAQGGYKDDLSGAVAPCAGVSWTGLRVGGFIGVGMTGVGSGTASISDGENYAHRSVFGGYQMSTFGEIELGADYQFKGSPVVIGVFGDLGYGSGAMELTYGAKLRAGLAYGNALVYGFAGVEKAHYVHDLSTAGGNSIVSLSADPAGVAYGLGVDVALGRGWYAGVRYERVNLGSLKASGDSYGYHFSAESTATNDRGLLTVGYKF